MANKIDQEEVDGKEQFRSKHWHERVKKVRRYAMVKIRNEATGVEKLVRRINFFKEGHAERGLRDKYAGTPWKFVSDYSADADIHVEETPDGLKPLDRLAVEAYEKNFREREAAILEGKAEMEAIREEMRKERERMQKLAVENRKLEAKIEKDKAETKELLEGLGAPSTVSKKKRAAKKKAAAKASTPPAAPPEKEIPTPPATPVTDVQKPASSPSGARAI